MFDSLWFSHLNWFWLRVESHWIRLRCVWINYQLARCNNDVDSFSGSLIAFFPSIVRIINRNVCVCAWALSSAPIFLLYWKLVLCCSNIVKQFSYHFERNRNQPLSKSVRESDEWFNRWLLVSLSFSWMRLFRSMLIRTQIQNKIVKLHQNLWWTIMENPFSLTATL